MYSIKVWPCTNTRQEGYRTRNSRNLNSAENAKVDGYILTINQFYVAAVL